MSEREINPQPSSEDGAKRSSLPSNDGEAFRRAENLLAVENQDGNERARQAFVAIEHPDRPSNLTDDSNALTRHITVDNRGDHDVDATADDEVDDALDQKAREDGVVAANDTSQIGWDLTPHNL